MFSKVLNRDITAADGDSIDIDDAQDVADEVGSNLIRLNAKLKIVGNRARRQAEEKTLKEWEILTNVRADLAALHQTLLKRISAANKRERELEAKRRQEGKTFADYFKDVVRCEADRVDYQRWILQAEMRYKAGQPELERD
jgi:2-phospho-L-lactate guanylyltransferase (CobY/MobA/RfbA family)